MRPVNMINSDCVEHRLSRNALTTLVDLAMEEVDNALLNVEKKLAMLALELDLGNGASSRMGVAGIWNVFHELDGRTCGRSSGSFCSNKDNNPTT
jgi:hypothetical protein